MKNIQKDKKKRPVSSFSETNRLPWRLALSRQRQWGGGWGSGSPSPSAAQPSGRLRCGVPACAGCTRGPAPWPSWWPRVTTRHRELVPDANLVAGRLDSGGSRDQLRGLPGCVGGAPPAGSGAGSEGCLTAGPRLAMSPEARLGVSWAFWGEGRGVCAWPGLLPGQVDGRVPVLPSAPWSLSAAYRDPAWQCRTPGAQLGLGGQWGGTATTQRDTAPARLGGPMAVLTWEEVRAGACGQR